MADQVDEIKQKTDIVSLVSEFIELKKAGTNYKALCPFHSEKTPSFMVSPELQIFKCFGCGEVGDAISFLQKYEGMDFYEALKFLAERAGIKLSPMRHKDRGEKEKLYEINSLAAKFYNYILLNHAAGKRALTYLTKQRGLTLNTTKKFQLGFSPHAPGALKKFLIDKKGFKAQDLEKAGLILARTDQAVDRFRGRVIFPLFDHRGNVTGFAGRTLPGSSASRRMAKYINSPETPVYHKGSLLYGLNFSRGDIKREKEAVVVEGELDMISSWQAGVKHTAAIKGSALTEGQVKLLSRLTKSIVLALDADLAGDTAARRGIARAQAQDLDVRVARLGNYKDPDEMARRAPSAFKKSLKSAVGVWDFIVDSIFVRVDETTGQGKAEISREAIPVLASIPDKIVQAHYVEVVARRLGVPTDAVTEQIAATMAKETQKPQVLGVVKPKPKLRRQLLEERLLTLAFQSQPKILLEGKIASLVKTPLAKRILEECQSFSKKHKSFDPSAFAEALPNELVEGFAEMILKDTQGLADEPERVEKELKLVVKELTIVEIKSELLKLAKKMRQYEEKRNKGNLRRAEEKFGTLSRKLASFKEDENRGIIL